MPRWPGMAGGEIGEARSRWSGSAAPIIADVVAEVNGQTPAGWYPDPYRQAEHRWWDGTVWTGWTAPAPSRTEPGGAGMTTGQDAGTITPEDRRRIIRGKPIVEDEGRGFWARSLTSIHGEPLPFLSRPGYRRSLVTSGLGVLFGALAFVLVGLPFLLAPWLNSGNSPWMMLGAIPPFLIVLFMGYHAIRRMVWEHSNGGIWRRSRDDLIGFALVPAVLAAILFVPRLFSL